MRPCRTFARITGRAYRGRQKAGSAIWRLLQIALVAGVFAAAFALFQHSENGRYRYTTNGNGNGNDGIIVDTRTGEFWTAEGSHFQPREARITFHHPAVDNQTANDDSSNKFMDCINNALHEHKEVKDCVAQQKFDFQPDSPKPASTSDNSH